MNKWQQSKQRGAVALITAMIVSVLLMITTAGMVSLTVKSLRQSTDGAQSTKAYYAAEGGLEEALLALSKDPNYTGNCSGAGSAASAQSGVVTCIKVDTSANTLSGELGANEAVQLDVSAVSGLQSLKIEWGTPGDFEAGQIPDYTTNGFPEGGDWSQKAPAVLEVGLVEFPNSESFTINQVNYHQATLVPERVGASNGVPFYAYADRPGGPVVANCDQPAPYQCSTGAGGLQANKKYVIRLKTRYNGAKYRITAQGAGNTPLSIPGAVYTIDVTARAGDVFRRIQTSFPTSGTFPTSPTGLDYVLYSDTDICKSFQVKGSVQELDPGAGLSCLP